MSAPDFKVDNLTAFIDWNKIQATGVTKEIFGIPELGRKWAAFGWEMFRVDGHGIGKIIDAIENAEKMKGKPCLILLDAVKGKDFSRAEINAAYHNGILDGEKLDRAMRELDVLKARLA